MFLTRVLLAKAKAKFILVEVKSVVSGHSMTRRRERLADKLEFIAYDPQIGLESVYREAKKIKSFKKE